jgi:hypothetical protein
MWCHLAHPQSPCLLQHRQLSRAWPRLKLLSLCCTLHQHWHPLQANCRLLCHPPNQLHWMCHLRLCVPGCRQVSPNQRFIMTAPSGMNFFCPVKNLVISRLLYLIRTRKGLWTLSFLPLCTTKLGIWSCHSPTEI